MQLSPSRLSGEAMTVPDRPARPKITVTRELTDGVMQRMQELFDATLNRADRALTRAELEQAVAVNLRAAENPVCDAPGRCAGADNHRPD